MIFDFSNVGQIIFSGLSNGTLYAFIGLGFGLVSRSTGIINFAQGEFVMLGAMLTATLTQFGLPVLLAAAIAVAITTLISAIFYKLAIEPARNATIAQLVLITIGLSILLRGAATTIWGAAPIPVPGFSGDRPISVLGISVLPQEIWLSCILVVVAFGIAWLFQRTTIGLAMRAGASNPLGAAFLGIDHRRLGFYAFILAGALGGIGGAAWSPLSFAQVDIGLALGLKGFIAAAIGGFSRTYGPIGGGILLGLMEALGAGFISSAYQDLITYGVLLIVLIYWPQGLFGGQLPNAHEAVTELLSSAKPSPTTIVSADMYKMIALAGVLVAAGFSLQGVWLTSAIFAIILAIVVIGLVLLTGYCGQLSLGQGAFMMLGAYSSGYLTLQWRLYPLLAMAVGVILSIIVALVLGRALFKLSGYYLSMASLALLMIGLTLARELVSITGGANGLAGIEPITLFGWSFSDDRSFYALASVVLIGVLGIALSVTRSRIGRSMLAVRSSPSAAQASGVDVGRLKAQAFAFSAAVASVAGSLYVHYLGIANPIPFGVDATIMQLTALTLGGLLSLWGAVMGSAVVTAIPTLILFFGGSAANQIVAGLQYLTFGVLLIVIVVFQSRETPKPVVAVSRLFENRFGHRKAKVL
ncbi:ABC transporter permease [Roseiarcaceae bacterium H3SJ34-1]|uniref:ABC transporter permease n=1 Tax=Terripilifer ovatus TaxID=3032367 RepID=UPI003AB9A7E6|nr:ABC transporter permease [Roseiarcaceae bacterium H3SJ34-1]